MATPFALSLVFAGLLGAKLLNLPRPVGVAVLIASFLFVLAVSIWEPISPLLYALSLAVSFIAIAFGFAFLYSDSNLIGLVVIVVVAFGIVIGVSVAASGSLLRTIELPRWVPLGLVVAVVVFSVATNLWLLWTQHEHSRKILAVVDEIRRAELAYAAAQPDHAFTCNGPDLPGLKNIEWKANEALGLQEKSRTYIEDHWLDLSCEAAAHPRRVWIVAGSWWGHELQVRVTE